MGLWIVLIVAVAVVAWIALSNDRLAVALRVRFTGAKGQIASSVDDAVARIDTAINQADANMVKAKEGLVLVKSQRRGLETKLVEANAAVAGWTEKAETAAASDRPDLVKECLSRRNAAQAVVEELRPQMDAIKASETKIEQNVTVLEAKKADLRAKRAEVVRRATTAKVVLSTNDLLAGIDLDSGSAHVEVAEQMVSELEAKAGAMEEMAEVARADDRLENELAALGRPDVDAEVQALMAKHKPAAGAS